MARIVVTRLRLRDAAFFDAFLTAAFAVVEQAQASDGNAAADVLAEANQTYWTRTVWRDKQAMRKFMVAEPHRSTMDAIDEWCDEATFASWDQPDAVLPQWSEAYTRLVTEGSVVDLAHASADNESRRFPAPVLE